MARDSNLCRRVSTHPNSGLFTTRRSLDEFCPSRPDFCRTTLSFDNGSIRRGWLSGRNTLGTGIWEGWGRRRRLWCRFVCSWGWSKRTRRVWCEITSLIWRDGRPRARQSAQGSWCCRNFGCSVHVTICPASRLASGLSVVGRLKSLDGSIYHFSFFGSGGPRHACAGTCLNNWLSFAGVNLLVRSRS